MPAPIPNQLTLFGERPRYAPGLRALGHDLYAWLLPNGGWGESNCGLIVGAGASLLVDTFWDLPQTQQMLDGLAPLLTSSPITQVVNTHADGDHWWGNQLVGGAQVIATAAATAEMRHHTPAQMRVLQAVAQGCGQVSRLPLSRRWRAGVQSVGAYLGGMQRPFDFAGIRPTLPTTTFTGHLQVDVGGRAVELIEVGPAHTGGDVIVYVPDARTVFAGDIVFVGSTPVMWAGSVRTWIAALERILALDVETVVPGHGPVTDRAGVEAVRRYWVYLEAVVRAQQAAGRTAAAAAQWLAQRPEMQGAPFGGWECPERLAINVAALYRDPARQQGALHPLAQLNLLRQMALLARAFPDALPASLHGQVVGVVPTNG
jgi:glyoxylase-like metal-dependent hydrolase (beta-lactamase superfamily II)